MASPSSLVFCNLAPVTEAARTILEVRFDSLSIDAQEQIDRAWREEVLHRMGQVRRGEVELESWEDVRRAGREALAR